MTTQLQKILDLAKSIEEVLSVEAIEPTQHILNQIENKDSICFDFLIQTKTEKMPFAIVVPKVLVDSAGDSLHIPIKDLLLCGCTQVEDGIGHICGYSVFNNTGKMIYYVRESDQQLIKLIDVEAPSVFIQSENLKKLVIKLKSLDKVNSIVVEEIVDKKLKESLDSKTPIIIKAYIDINSDRVVDHFVSFVVTELVYDIETSHEWAVNSLIDLIEKNNTI